MCYNFTFIYCRYKCTVDKDGQEYWDTLFLSCISLNPSNSNNYEEIHLSCISLNPPDSNDYKMIFF